MTGSESFFDVLKSKRKSQNIEISEICEFTKINPRYIESIEKGDFTVLPNVYLRLFLKSYAKFIGADSAKALKDYELDEILENPFKYRLIVFKNLLLNKNFTLSRYDNKKMQQIFLKSDQDEFYNSNYH